ncbi:DUF4232 domain-containing protein [Streptomyces sp. NPDC006012]|uniref:DUF4232 domain-containing protein n=1 Tax=Streptomyces sp. NPDC006012 TaxID=3364739 RepID=UPI0036C08C32
MRTFRIARSARSRTRLCAATSVAVAALALTACNDGTGMRDEGASFAASAQAGASVHSTPQGQSGGSTKSAAGKGNPEQSGNSGSGTGSSSGSNSSSGSGSSAGSKSSSGSGSASEPWDPANRVLCNGANTQVKAEPVARPLNRMLITVKNTGSKYCDMPYYPVLRFDEMQWAPQGEEATRPQAVVTLAPGESGYAGVMLQSPEGDGGTTSHKLTIAFQGKTPNSTGGASAIVKLPADGVYYDSSLKVSFWQQNSHDAIDW